MAKIVVNVASSLQVEVIFETGNLGVRSGPQVLFELFLTLDSKIGHQVYKHAYTTNMVHLKENCITKYKNC